jgi:hypothetical protein
MREEVQDYNTPAPRPVERVINPSNTSGIDGLLSRLAPEPVAHEPVTAVPVDNLHQAVEAITQATTIEQLKTEAGPMCAALGEQDQADARFFYKQKLAFFKGDKNE